MLPGLGHKPFIAVSGTIGAAKSTLVKLLADAFDVPPYLEEANRNPFFGAEPERALQSQLWFLTQALSAVRAASGSRGGVVERPPEEHLDVFVRAWAELGWLDSGERDALEAAYSASVLPRTPDLLIQLDIDAGAALTRVQGRARPEEQAVTLGYLESLERNYSSFIRRWDASPVLRVRANEIDLRSPQGFDRVLSDVQAHLDRDLPVMVDHGTLPWRAHAGDAGLDVMCATDVTIPPLHRLKVGTGLRMHIPEGHVGLLAPRSSLAANHGVTQLDGPGVIDASYRGEIHLLLYNTDGSNTYHAPKGSRLAQLVIVPFAELRPRHVDGLSPSDRGDSGFGGSNTRYMASQS